MNKEEKAVSVLDNKVSLTNLAARSAQGFTLREKRLFSCGLSQLDSRKPGKQLSLKDRTFRVTAKQYSELAQIADEKSAYKDLMAACENIRKRYLRYKVETPKGTKERILNWISSLTYHHGEGWVEFSLTDEIMNHVSGLREEFTSYRLRQASELRSIYSWRLLELLTSHIHDEFKGWSETITLENLSSALEIPESYKYNDTKKRVIEPSVKELTEKDGWVITWEPIKTGRSVAAIKFTYRRDNQADLFRE